MESKRDLVFYESCGVLSEGKVLMCSETCSQFCLGLFRGLRVAGRGISGGGCQALGGRG